MGTAVKFTETVLNGLYSIMPELISDDRGFFVRSFCLNEFSRIRGDIRIVQINHSMTKKAGSIRGMHFQLPPYCEIKIVRCIKGVVYDVAIDLRKDSKTFMQWHGEILTAGNMKMLMIPEGFAHGFQTLEDDCEMLYLHSEFYIKEYECGIRYDDPSLGIKWKIPITNISERDRKHPLIENTFRGIEA